MTNGCDLVAVFRLADAYHTVSLRQLFLRERRLLGILPRCAYETIRRTFTNVLGQEYARPGMVAAPQTFGSQLNFNPHLHCLISDGVFRKGGEFVPFPLFDEDFEKLLTEPSVGWCSTPW